MLRRRMPLRVPRRALGKPQSHARSTIRRSSARWCSVWGRSSTTSSRSAAAAPAAWIARRPYVHRGQWVETYSLLSEDESMEDDEFDQDPVQGAARDFPVQGPEPAL